MCKGPIQSLGPQNEKDNKVNDSSLKAAFKNTTHHPVISESGTQSWVAERHPSDDYNVVEKFLLPSNIIGTVRPQHFTCVSVVIVETNIATPVLQNCSTIMY